MLIHYLEFNFKFVRRLLKKRVFFCNFVAKIEASSRVERGTRNEERGTRNEESVNTHWK